MSHYKNFLHFNDEISGITFTENINQNSVTQNYCCWRPNSGFVYISSIWHEIRNNVTFICYFLYIKMLSILFMENVIDIHQYTIWASQCCWNSLNRCINHNVFLGIRNLSFLFFMCARSNLISWHNRIKGIITKKQWFIVFPHNNNYNDNVHPIHKFIGAHTRIKASWSKKSKFCFL